jgi:MFS family permease
MGRRAGDLRLLAGAVGLSALGDLLAMITLALRVHDLTGSGLAVSALFAATFVPMVALAPLAGLLVDRVESARLLALTSLAQAAVALGLAFTSDVGAILALTALLAAGAAVSQPAEFALVPAVAGSGRLTEANGLIEAARYAGFAAGPVLAGVLAAGGDTRLALVVNAASFLAIAGGVACMRARRPPPSSGSRGERARDGLAHLLGDRVLRATVGSATFALLFISASMTAEVFYAKDVLRVGDAGYAALVAAWTLGMVASAAGLAGRVPKAVLAPAALIALGVQGGGLAAQTAWTILPAALAGYLVGGVGHGIKNTLGPRAALLIAGLGPVLASVGGLVALRRPTDGQVGPARAANPRPWPTSICSAAPTAVSTAAGRPTSAGAWPPTALVPPAATRAAACRSSSRWWSSPRIAPPRCARRLGSSGCLARRSYD